MNRNTCIRSQIYVDWGDDKCFISRKVNVYDNVLIKLISVLSEKNVL